MTTQDTQPHRLRLDIAYDGTDFHGWAAQPGLRTVQGELEDWTQRILRLPEPVELTCAGRTDAGVHARGQVAHFDLPDQRSSSTPLNRLGPTSELADSHLNRVGSPLRSSTPLNRLGHASELAGSRLNRVSAEDAAEELARRYRRALPGDIVVSRVTIAPPGFDARFSAIWRRYTYRLIDPSGSMDPLLRGHIATFAADLDVAAMNDATPHLLGLRDFAALCKAREGATTIRDLQTLSITQTSLGVIEIKVRADAFCHSMVRSLVGALVAVGSGRRDLDWLDETLAARKRSNHIAVMPAVGLVLEEVGYPPPEEMGARATESRAFRTLEDTR